MSLEYRTVIVPGKLKWCNHMEKTGVKIQEQGAFKDLILLKEEIQKYFYLCTCLFMLLYKGTSLVITDNPQKMKF